jgi:DNA-binding transcriptional MerR regulator
MLRRQTTMKKQGFGIEARRVTALFEGLQLPVSERSLRYWNVLGLLNPWQNRPGRGVPRFYGKSDLLEIAVLREMQERMVATNVLGEAIQKLREAYPLKRQICILIVGKEVSVITEDDIDWHIPARLSGGKNVLKAMAPRKDHLLKAYASLGEMLFTAKGTSYVVVHVHDLVAKINKAVSELETFVREERGKKTTS